MLIEFSVGNFRSIKDIETLSMLAGPKVSSNKELDEKNVHRVSDKLTLLKSKAIYGANASGKSNIVKALQAFTRIIVNSVKDETTLGKSISPFKLSTETEKSPTFFQMVFLLNGVTFRYGFEADRQSILTEWLFGRSGKREVKYFTREMNSVSVNNSNFKDAEGVAEILGSSDSDIARNNTLFLSATRALTRGLAKDIVDYMAGFSVVSSVSDHHLHERNLDMVRVPESRSRILELLKVADIGIEQMDVRDFNVGDESHPFVVALKSKFDRDQNKVGSVDMYMLMDESEGSQKMFELGPEIIACLRSGRPLIIDEFDARFHPELTRKLVELMNSHSNKNGQVIFVTHNTNLLDSDLLRRDQICLVEKDRYGASHFFTLADFKGVRNDAQFEKDYLSGRYGAIPLLGDFESLLED